jgi:hypothetical protein
MSTEQVSIRVATSWKVDRCDMVFVSAEGGVGGTDVASYESAFKSA